MSKERYAEHTVAWELPNRDSVTKGNYNLADIETKYLPIQTEVVSDNKDQTINKLQHRISELEEQLKNTPKYTVYSKVFFIDDCEKIIKEDFVEQITINHRDGIYYELVNNLLFEECELFATKEEAQAKLKKCEKLQ